MDATTTPHIAKILAAIHNDFPYRFSSGEIFSWRPAQKQIEHAPIVRAEDLWSLLHEISHAELGHTGFGMDIELLRLETAAWHHAATRLASNYTQIIDPDFIEDSLDTYRLWLHKRSTCPDCQQVGLQTTQNTYSCINCRCLWRVNEARLCQLKRTRLRGQNRSVVAVE